ncbi:MAG: phospholipid/cholesterol/gamma-HCH transport system substrate-binding protein [Solirubrobacteraceae bacterium]|jgi:phospholipid/cholesterol/gamma-HCH transport system substrate-binding protein|nr:phospholipid/cholesterol/gamma-HCH transport system substrate-binding protein [Solirubrobacteraceae bacterium]
MTAIRKHLVDFAAIIALLVLAVGVSSYILTNQRLTLPAWVPLIGKDFYEFKGEFATGQAVTPGQGQTVNVAGVNVGEISSVDLHNGKAVLTLRLDDPDVHVYKNATMLLRPKTGLKDMTVELDPGTKSSGALKERATIPVGQTQPDVNLDELLAALDGDTRQWLTILITSGGEGLKGRGKDLGDTIRTFGPTARALERINGALATRRENIKRVMHNFSLVAGELGDKDDQLAHFVNTNGAVLRVLANQEADIRATLRELPSALRETRTGLEKTGNLTAQLGPAFNDLLPGARALGPMQRALRPFFRETTPVIHDSVRPLVRATRPVITELRPTIRSLSSATSNLYITLRTVNRLLDILAYNPPGDEEGYLFWLSWANHLGANVFNTQDAHGPIRRGSVVIGCDALAVLDQVAAVNEVLGTTIGLINLPRTSQVCSQPQGQTR